MGENYKVYSTQQFIKKTPTGSLDFNKSLALLRQLAIASEFHDNHNILLDLRDTEKATSFGELLMLSMELVQYQNTFENKVAFLIPDEPERIERAEFVVKSSLYKKKIKLDYFTEYEKAIEWLSDISEY